MSDPPPPSPASRPKASKPEGPTRSGETARDDRLKAALKANMARRKAQARARAAGADMSEPEDK